MNPDVDDFTKARNYRKTTH